MAPDVDPSLAAIPAPASDRVPDARWRTWIGPPAIRMSRLLVIAAFLPAVGWIAGRSWWALDLLSHFPLQAALGSIVVGIVAFLLRRPKLLLSAVVALAINAVPVIGLWIPVRQPEAGGASLRVCSVNVFVGNDDPTLLLELLRREQPEVLYVSELTEDFDQALRASHQFPFAYSRPEYESPWGTGLYSTRPLIDPEFRPREFGCPTVVAAIEVDGQRVTIAGAHPVPPAGGRFTRLRDDLLEATARHLADQTVPVILCGDFNATPWSYAFRDLLSRSHLRDARQGFGLAPTWPRNNPLLRIPIDYVLVSSGVAVLSHRIGASIGSDHFPVLVDVRLPAFDATRIDALDAKR